MEKMEIHCFLNNYIGLVPSCHHQWISLEWLSETNTTLNSKRFSVKSETKCFSKLIFKPRPTDHRRTWRCQLRENGTVITSLGRTINITGIHWHLDLHFVLCIRPRANSSGLSVGLMQV